MSNLWKLWFNKNSLGEKLRIRIYNAYIKPILIYNSGTWGLTKTKMKGLESFHRSLIFLTFINAKRTLLLQTFNVNVEVTNSKKQVELQLQQEISISPIL